MSGNVAVHPAAGDADGFRVFTIASQTPASLQDMDLRDLPRRVAALYAQASPPERVTLLNRLLRPLGPLALVTVAAGAFAGLLPSGPDARWREAEVSLDDTRRLGTAQVLALADYVAQKDPGVLVALAGDDTRPLPA